MVQFFTKTLLACLLGTIASQAFTQEGTAPDIVISSGLEGGGYWNTAGQLQAAARDAGLTVENQASTGSLANLKALTNERSPVSVAFTQADALQYYMNQNPDAGQVIEKLERLGEECVFIISDSDSKIDSIEDIQKSRRMGLGIRSPNSGIRVTYDYMTSLAPEMQHISVFYGGTVDFMENFRERLTEVKAIMIVQGPNERSPEIDLVMKNPDHFNFVKVKDKRLTQKTSGGEAIYHSKKVAPGAVKGAGRVQTICMQGALVANKNKLSAEQRSALTGLLSSHWSRVSGTGK